MSNQISTQTFSFYGSDLITLKIDDVIYTAVRPIVEALGLSWGSQQRKLENSKEKFNCTHMSTVAEDGKIRAMLCMPLKKLNGWLFSINPEKVRPDLKEKVICYQEECFEALYNYWHFGKAERSQNPQPNLPLELPKTPRKLAQAQTDQFGNPLYNRVLSNKEMEWLVHLWYIAEKQKDFIKSITPALEAMHSAFLEQTYRFNGDFIDIRLAGRVLADLTKGAKVAQFAPLIKLNATFK